MKRFLTAAMLLAFLSIAYISCGLEMFDTATRKFDGLIGDTLAEKMGETLESVVSNGEDTYENKDGVSIRVLTPTPTFEPGFVPTTTPFIIATPTPMTDEPEGEKVDEWVYAVEACNVRSGWSTEYLVCGGLVQNDCVHRVAILSNGWSKISYNGTYAYVYGELLTREKPARVATTHLDAMEYSLEATRAGEDVYILEIKNIMQKPELVNGPEITCLTTVLHYLGYDAVSKTVLCDSYLEKAEVGTDTPFNAYIGDPRSPVNGYGCYAPVIVKAADKWFEDKNIQKKAVDVSGRSMAELLEFVKKGTPVICWTTVGLEATTPGMTWEIDGASFTWQNKEHCVVLCGYNNTKNKVIVCDPLRGLVEYDKALFYMRYTEQFSSAVIITNQVK